MSVKTMIFGFSSSTAVNTIVRICASNSKIINRLISKYNIVLKTTIALSIKLNIETNQQL